MICYIVDDENHSINSLKRFIDKVPSLVLAGSNTSSVAAVNEINQLKQVDLIFLDVDMPDLSGLQVAGLIPKYIYKIFTTAHSSYAADAFDLNAQDFLIKPFSLERFIQAIQKIEALQAMQQTQKKNDVETFFINPGVRGKIVQIPLKEILYIEGLKNYVIIYTVDGTKHITYLTMNEIEQSLTRPNFFRIHKSYIVNKEKIKSIEGNRVFMNNVQLNMGAKYKEVFMEFISYATLRSKR